MSKQTRSYENECYQNNESENASSEKCGAFYAQNLIVRMIFSFWFCRNNRLSIWGQKLRTIKNEKKFLLTHNVSICL